MATSFEARVRLTGLAFGEAPRWHDGRLWFSDFYRRGIYSLGEEGERLEHATAFQPSGLGWTADGTLLVTSMTECAVLAIAPGGEVRRHADISPWCAFWANDLVVADDGTAYVGNFGFDFDAWVEGLADLPQGASVPPPPTTSLVAVAQDGSARAVAEDLTFPNGMVLTEDGSTLIVAETLAQRLTAFDVAPDGSLSNRRCFAETPTAYPDGICLDAEGQVWLAAASSPRCLRVREGGEVTATVTTARTSYACMLGGDDRRELFCCTAPISTAKVVSAARDGAIESARVEVPGAGRP